MDNDTLSNIRGCIYASCTTEGASKLSDALDEYASKLGEAAERGALMSNELDVLVADRDQWKGRADQLSEERDSLEGRLEEREKERSALSSRLAQYAQASLAPGNEQRKRIADLEDRLDVALGLLREVHDSGAAFSDSRLSYDEVQLDKDLVERIGKVIVVENRCVVCGQRIAGPALAKIDGQTVCSSTCCSAVEIPTTNEPLGVYAHRLLKTKARLDE